VFLSLLVALLFSGGAGAERVLQKVTPGIKVFIDQQAVKYDKKGCLSDHNYAVDAQINTMEKFQDVYRQFLADLATARKMTGSTNGIVHGTQGKEVYWVSMRSFGAGVFTYVKFSGGKTHIYACKLK
jgi:hypothetical protein